MINKIFKRLLCGVGILMLLGVNVLYALEETPRLYVEEAFGVGPRNIAVVFSNSLDATSIEEEGSLFRIEEVNPTSNYFNVIEKELDEYNANEILLTLDKDLVDGTEYRVTVLSITDAFGQNIVYGIDSEATFIYVYNPEGFNSALDNPSNSGSIDDEIDDIILNSGDITNTDENSTGDRGSVVGESVDADTIENQVEVVANDNAKLPQAGAEHVVLIMLALLLGATFFILRYKNS